MAKPKTTAGAAKPASKTKLAGATAPEPTQAAAQTAALHGVLASLAPLCDAHGAQLDMPPAEQIVPGATIHIHVHHPVSVERFVEAARATAGVRAVQVLPTGVRLHVAVPADG